MVEQFHLKKLLVFAIFISTVFIYQNCGQPGQIMMTSQADPFQSPLGVNAQYEEISMDKPSYPDLKIFLVLDNSDSMRANQIRLKDSISAMFTQNKDSLVHFNSQTFIVTTSQLNAIQAVTGSGSAQVYNSPLRPLIVNDIGSMKDPANFSNSADLSFLNIQRADPMNSGVTGLVAGDIIGFKSKVSPPVNGRTAYDYVAAPVFDFKLGSGYNPTRSMASVDYKAGESVNDYIQKIGERIDVINPEKVSLTTNSQNVNMQTVIEDESGLCAIARVLRTQKKYASFYKPGDIASVIIASDEKESNPDGSRCVFSDVKYQDPYYEAQCIQPNSYVEYKMKEKLTTLSIKKPYKKAIEWQRKFTATRAKKDAVCKGTGVVSSYAYKIKVPAYNVNYSKETYLVYEGGKTSLMSVEDNLQTGDISGAMAAGSCLTAAELSTHLGLANSSTRQYKVKNISCSDKTTYLEGTSNFSEYRFVADGSACLMADQNNILAIYAGGAKEASMVSCAVKQNNVSVALNLSGNPNFSSTSLNAADCDAAFTSYCSGRYSNCQRNSYSAYIAPDTRNSAANGPLITTYTSCTAAVCGDFPEICGPGASASTTLAAWSTSNGYTCAAGHPVTKTIDDNESNATLITKRTNPDVSIKCDSLCVTHPEYCPSVNGFSSTNKTIAAYNLGACSQPTNYEAYDYPVRTLKDIPNPDRVAYSCNTSCKNANLCGNEVSDIPVSTHLKNFHNNNYVDSCSVKFKNGDIQVATNPDQAKLACNKGYELQASTISLKTPNRIEATLVDQDFSGGPRVGLKNYIQQQVMEDFGPERFSMATFTTKAAQATPQFTAGTEYENMMDLLSQDASLKRSVSSASDYPVALTYLSQKIADQIRRVFAVQTLRDGQQIRRIWFKSDEVYWEEIPVSQYRVTGRTFTIIDPVLFARSQKEANVKFKVEIY